MVDARYEVAALAARWVVEEGLDYASAKQRAMRNLGLTGRGGLPDNRLLQEAVREHLAIFCADTQPLELRAMRECAGSWMERLRAFRPHLSGAVWQGTATRLSGIELQLFCEDCKQAEFWLIDQGISYAVHSRPGFRSEPVSVLVLDVFCPQLGEKLGLSLTIHDQDDLRVAARSDASGRALRGDLKAVHGLLEAQE